MIQRALIPLAGLGTRMRPFTLVAPKAMLPLVDSAGAVRPVIDYIVAEAAAAGAEEVGLIVSPGQRELIEAYFARLAEGGDATGGGAAKRLPRIEFILQSQPLGFGDAVSMGQAFVGGRDFLLLLGDHVYLSEPGQPACAAQVAGAFGRLGGSAVIGMQPVEEGELSKVGVAGGVEIGPRTFRCTDFIEKPSPQEARRRLATPGLTGGEFLAHCGIYAFSPEIFECLEELKRTGRRTRGEVQLADAQEMLLDRHRQEYYLYRIAGAAYDVGTPEDYVRTFMAFAGGA